VDVPAAAERWLQQMAAIRDVLQDAADAPRGAALGLIYVLAPDREGNVPGLYPHTVRLRQDGSIAEAMLEEDPLRLLKMRPPHVGREHDEPLRLLGAMQVSHHTLKPAGALGAALME
jgi:hypothetical protein